MHILTIKISTLHSIHCTTCVTLLHVSAPKWHFQAVFYNKGRCDSKSSMLDICYFVLKSSLMMASRCRDIQNATPVPGYTGWHSGAGIYRMALRFRGIQNVTPVQGYKGWHSGSGVYRMSVRCRDIQDFITCHELYFLEFLHKWIAGYDSLAGTETRYGMDCTGILTR